jgi:hypothetical protein
MNLQFIKQKIIGRQFLDQVQEILVPDGQFKEDQPNLASLCFIAQQINYDYD